MSPIQVGATLSLAIPFAVLATLLARRTPPLGRIALVSLGILAASLLVGLGGTALQWRGLLADRAPLLSLWALLMAAAAWTRPAAGSYLEAASGRRGLAAGAVLILVAVAALPAPAQLRGLRALEQAKAADQEDPAARLAEAATARPWDPEPWFLLGGIALELKDYPKARGLYASALACEPDHVEALVAAWLVEMVDPHGDPAAGFPLLERAEELAPDAEAVKEARPRWLESVAQRHLEFARVAVGRGAERTRELMCSVYVTEARVALLRGMPEEVPALLSQAAAMADGSARIQLERLAARDTVEEPLLAEFCIRRWPTWPQL